MYSSAVGARAQLPHPFGAGDRIASVSELYAP